ncbi:MAG: ABC transporter substrate-binding protein [bacterium]|nr:ABC transporter substrate-binding protein [bacterium]
MLRSTRVFFWFLRSSIQRYWKRYLLIVCILASIGGFLFQNPLKMKRSINIGVVGSTTEKTLPREITKKISRSLMTLSPGGIPTKDIVEQWEVSEDGKSYTFHIQRGLFWHDGRPVYADNIASVFTESHVEVLDSYTIRFSLTEPFSPFLATIATKPILQGLSGFGPYRVSGVSHNGENIETLILEDETKKLVVHFYPNQQSGQTALKLGEIQLFGTTLPMTFNWENIEVTNVPSSKRALTLFFRMTHPLLGSKAELRAALGAAAPRLPAVDGQLRPIGPIAPTSWAYSEPTKKFAENLEFAKQLLSDLELPEGDHAFTLTTTGAFEQEAKDISAVWETLGFQVKVDIQPTIPEEFDVLLTDLDIPETPDQYMLWHSTRATNITKYKSERIDKLLEDGRMVLDIDAQKKIYADFQRYFIDDAPAYMLSYLPYTIYHSKKISPEEAKELLQDAY